MARRSAAMPGVQTCWLVVTTAIVLFLAAYGSIRMLDDGSGGGQGPNPIARPANAGKALQVQVIAQQWKFTYRYPAYGGVETPTLELPANRLIELHVTSLDVIHSFWAYQLGVKADANPGIDNIAYVQTKAPLKFDIHCAELCGVWHGYMFETGQRRRPEPVRDLDPAAAAAIRAGEEVAAAVRQAVLPGPTEERRMSAIAVKAGRPPHGDA